MLHVLRQATIVGKLRYYFLERNHSLTIRWGLAGLCLTLTIVSALLLRDVESVAAATKGFMPALALAGVAGFYALYRNLELALILMVVVSTVLSDGLGTGSGTKLTFTFLLLHLTFFIWAFKMVVVERKIRVRAAPGNKWALAFIIAVLVAFAWSAFYVDDAVSYLYYSKAFPRIMTAAVLIISPLTYFMYANLTKSYSTIKAWVWWFIAIGAFLMIFRLQDPVEPPLNVQGQFPTWVVALALGQALFNTRLRLPLRLGLLVITSGWFYITMGLGISWLSGWLPVGLVGMVLAFMFSRRLFVILLIVAALAAYSDRQGIEETLSAETTESGDSRQEAWDAALNLGQYHYLFGTGPAGYAYYYWTYILANYSHNNYIDIFMQTGIVGFVVFVGFWLMMVRMAWKNYRSAPRVGFAYALSLSLLAINLSHLLTMMLGDWVTPFTYTQSLAGIDYTIWSWMLAGITVAAYYFNREQAVTGVIVPVDAPTSVKSVGAQ